MKFFTKSLFIGLSAALALTACTDEAKQDTAAAAAKTAEVAETVAAKAAPASACGKIQIAEMDWASAELMANVDKIILEKGYGCDIELIPGATTTTFASMNEKGQPDVAPEMWVNTVREPPTKALKEGS